MSEYGSIIDNYISEINLNLIEYFDNPTMVKMKNVNNLSMYMTKNYCLLSQDCRYIVIFVTEDNLPIKTKKLMSELDWISIQTRTLNENYNLDSHFYNPVNKGPLKEYIYCIEKKQEYSIYSCEKFPIKITIFNTKKNEENPYQDKSTIISALETYNTIITKTN